MMRLKIIDKLGNTEIEKWLKFFEKSQYWSQNEILDHQNLLLKEMVEHCYQNVPYYKTLFDKIGLLPKDIQTAKDLVKIPILRKEDIKKDPDIFKARNFKEYSPVKKRTGGSTGVPFEYYNDRELRSIQWALKYLSWRRGGYQVGDKIAVMGGGSLFPNEKKSFKHVFRNKLNSFYKLVMTHFDTEMVDEYATFLEKNKIEFLRGYPSAIAMFAKQNRNQNLNIKAVFTTAEVLRPEYKEVIEKGLNAKVFDQYGCADAGAHASECEFNSIHVYDEITITEIVKDDKIVRQGEQGELVFTSLYNYSMPFLRYAPEDLAIENISNCPCGRHTTSLREISGRSTDLIRFKDGNNLSGPALTLIFSRVNVEKYQVVQHSWEEIEILLIPADNFKDEDLELIKSSLKKHTSTSVVIDVKIVEEIPLPVSGKFRFVISKIKFDEKI